MTVPSYFKQTKSKWWLYTDNNRDDFVPVVHCKITSSLSGTVLLITNLLVQFLTYVNIMLKILYFITILVPSVARLKSLICKVSKNVKNEQVQKYKKGDSSIFSLFLRQQPCLRGMLSFWHWAAAKVLYCQKGNMLSRRVCSNTQPSNYAKLTLTHFLGTYYFIFYSIYTATMHYVLHVHLWTNIWNPRIVTCSYWIEN